MLNQTQIVKNSDYKLIKIQIKIIISASNKLMNFQEICCISKSHKNLFNWINLTYKIVLKILSKK